MPTLNLDRYAAPVGIALSLGGLIWNAAIQTGRIDDHDRRIVALELSDAESLKDRREMAERLARIDANTQELLQRGRAR